MAFNRINPLENTPPFISTVFDAIRNSPLPYQEWFDLYYQKLIDLGKVLKAAQVLDSQGVPGFNVLEGIEIRQAIHLRMRQMSHLDETLEALEDRNLQFPRGDETETPPYN